MVTNFWRPIEMNEPLRYMPLTVCDPDSIELDDVVDTIVKGTAEKGKTFKLGMLKRNSNQKWFYYPYMENDEVLVFKQFECMKGIDD